MASVEQYTSGSATPFAVAARVAALYTVVGLLWVGLSDQALWRWLGPAGAGPWAQSAKGALFVLVSAGVIGLLVHRAIAACQRERSARAAAERRIAAVAETIPHGVSECNAEGRIVYANPGLHRLLGYPDGALVGCLTPELLFDEEAVERARAGVRRLIAGETAIVTYDTTYRHRDGGPVPVQVDWRCRVDADGTILGFVAAITDLTVRLRAEQALHESEARYALLVEGAPMGIGVHAGKRVVYANREAARLLGAEMPEALLDLPLETLVVPAEWPRISALCDSIYRKETRHVPSSEIRLRRLDGREIDVAFSSNAVDFGGEPASQVLFSDITPRREAERQLKRTLGELETLYREAPVGLAVVDTELRFVRVNEQLAEMNGASVEAHLGRTIGEVLPALAPTLEPLFRHIIDGGDGVSAKRISGATPRAPDEPRHWEVSYQPIHADGGRILGVNAVVQEVTELVRAERRQREIAAQLTRESLHLQRLNAELEEFTNVVAHDLKAPLRGVSYLSSWLSDELRPAGPEAEGKLRLLRERVGRMDGLIDALLEYSRAGTTLPETRLVDSRALAEEAFAAVGAPAGFRLEVGAEMPAFETCAEHLRQVFAYLIQNAVVHHNRPEQGKVRVEGRPDNDRYLFAVSDNGPGIPEAYRERVFAIFQTLGSGVGKDPRLGLGLAVVRKLVTSHDGRVWVERSSEGGTTICFSWRPDHDPFLAGAALRSEGLRLSSTDNEGSAAHIDNDRG